MNTWKQRMLRNWHLMRVLRLVMGIAILVQAGMMKDIPFFLIGLLFTAMPLFDFGCCASGTCAQPPASHKNNNPEIRYEEVV